MAKKRVKRLQQHGSAWHWKQSDSWFYTEPGNRKRMPLVDEKEERIRGKENMEATRLARVKLSDELQPTTSRNEGEWTIGQVCDAYLVNLHRTASTDWARQVKGWLNDLCGYCRALEVSEFKRRHLRNWLARLSNWSDNTKRNVIGSVKAAFNFCVKDGDIDVNPVAGYEKPTQVPRLTAFSPEEEKAIYEVAEEAFGLFIKACILAGARPYSELAKVTADHVVASDHGMYFELKDHKTARKTGKPRRILLTAEMEKITEKLVKASPPGSGRELIRSSRNRSWKRCNCVQRFGGLRTKLALPEDCYMYTCRHTFAKRTLAGYYTGQLVAIEVLAGLVGNTPKVCWQHYAQWADQYADPLWAARGRGRDTARGEEGKG